MQDEGGRQIAEGRVWPSPKSCNRGLAGPSQIRDEALALPVRGFHTVIRLDTARAKLDNVSGWYPVIRAWLFPIERR
jgi:hypothetical protein